MPEGSAHLIIRTFVYQLLTFHLGPEHSVGSEQFVYWMRNNPGRCLSPDVFVKLHVAQTTFPTWRCWERGAPELAVEVVSPNEGDGIRWELARYAELGVEELLRFDPEEASGRRLRAWDRVEEDFVERAVEGDRTPCVTLALHWVACPVATLDVGLRLADDAGTLIATRVEVAEAGKQVAEARAAAAEARLRELEEELRKRG